MKLPLRAASGLLRKYSDAVPTYVVAQPRWCSSSTSTPTYSGGQANVGQGGYYGSLKSRTEHSAEFVKGNCVEEEDLLELERIMEKVHILKEDSSEILTLMHTDDVQSLLNRLMIQGGPVWYVSSTTLDRQY